MNPHGAQSVFLIEDSENPDNRMYVLKDEGSGEIEILGSELDDLLKWWQEEKDRDVIQ